MPDFSRPADGTEEVAAPAMASAADPPHRIEASGQLGWLVFWMSGVLTAFIIAALSVRALADTLNAFEMKLA